MIKLNVGHNIKTLGNSEIHSKHLKIPVDVVLSNVGGLDSGWADFQIRKKPLFILKKLPIKPFLV